MVDAPAGNRPGLPPTSWAGPFDLLRLGLGVVWACNLLFVVVPSNAFFPTFSNTVAGFASSSLTGPAGPRFVAAHPVVFSAAAAALTAYLAVAFLTGRSVRFACLLGAGFAVALLVAQWGTTFTWPGGTDVGPQPLYLLSYLVVYRATRLDTPASRAWRTATPAADLRYGT